MIDKISSYLAIDPGHTIGWATFDEEGNILEYGQTKMEHFNKDFDKLLHSALKGVITEDYRNHPWMKQKGWGRNETSQIIGKIEMLAEMRQIPLHFQRNTVKSIGYKWAGLKQAPSNHAISHQYDAIAHGVYWLQSNNIRPVGKAIKDGPD
jgi:hypothetical protein